MVMSMHDNLFARIVDMSPAQTAGVLRPDLQWVYGWACYRGATPQSTSGVTLGGCLRSNERRWWPGGWRQHASWPPLTPRSPPVPMLSSGTSRIGSVAPRFADRTVSHRQAAPKFCTHTISLAHRETQISDIQKPRVTNPDTLKIKSQQIITMFVNMF